MTTTCERVHTLEQERGKARGGRGGGLLQVVNPPPRPPRPHQPPPAARPAPPGAFAARSEGPAAAGPRAPGEGPGGGAGVPRAVPHPHRRGKRRWTVRRVPRPLRRPLRLASPAPSGPWRLRGTERGALGGGRPGRRRGPAPPVASSGGGGGRPGTPRPLRPVPELKVGLRRVLRSAAHTLRRWSGRHRGPAPRVPPPAAPWTPRRLPRPRCPSARSRRLLETRGPLPGEPAENRLEDEARLQGLTDEHLLRLDLPPPGWRIWTRTTWSASSSGGCSR